MPGPPIYEDWWTGDWLSFEEFPHPWKLCNVFLTLKLVQPGVDGVEVVVVLPVHVAGIVERLQLGPVGDLLRVGVLDAVLNVPVLRCYMAKGLREI